MSGDTNVITSCTAAHASRQCADCARGCCLWFCTTCIDAKRADIQANTRWGMFRYALPCPAPTGYELYIHGSAIPCVYVCTARRRLQHIEPAWRLRNKYLRPCQLSVRTCIIIRPQCNTSRYTRITHEQLASVIHGVMNSSLRTP